MSASTLDTFVYFAECIDTIKIGYSREPGRRSMALRGKLLATVPGGRQLESRLHDRFDHVRAERLPRPGNADTEHFRKEPELLDFIERVTAGEHPESILAAEERAREEREYAELVERSRGSSLWLQARVVMTYASANYSHHTDRWADAQLATEQTFQVETAWECIDAGACLCPCRSLGVEAKAP